MGELTVSETLHEMDMSLVALLFNILLWAMVELQGYRKLRQGNRAFSNMMLYIMLANIVSCAATLVRFADLGLHPAIVSAFQLTAYMANTLVVYYFSVYIRTYYSRETAYTGKSPLFNRLLVLTEALILIAYYAWALPRMIRENVYVVPQGFLFIFVGFIVEIYFLLYAVLFFIRRRDTLDSRARTVVVVAFLITISTIIAQGFIGSIPLINYLGATLGLLVFYYNAETPDYHKLVAAMKELDAERERADKANASKSDFLANMSHEIRTPINAVIGMNEMILREGTAYGESGKGTPAGDSFERITTYAYNVEAAGKGLLSIINDILDFSKIEAGSMELNEAPYKLSSVLNDVSNMIAFRARGKNLLYQIYVDEETPEELYGDEVRIRQIMINLLNNAVKYTNEGAVILSVGKKEGQEKDAGSVLLEISVEDTGIGIRENDVEKLFQKFHRVDLKKNNTIEGTGLGLAITKTLVDMMHGTINVESVYGEGSTFSVCIPQTVVKEGGIGNFRERFRESLRERQTYRESFHAPDARILVVDDTEINLTVVKGLLQHTAIQIDTANGADAALERTKEKAYDLILMDQRMPGMDGTQALLHIRAQNGGMNSETPVICLTADAVQGARARYLEQGFSDYLPKPIEGRELERILRQYLPAGKVKMIREETKEEVFAQDAGITSFTPKKSGMRTLYETLDQMDYREALRYLGSDELIGKTLKQFCESLPERLEEISSSLASGDLEQYTIKVHALKSGAKTVGATKIAGMAYELEQYGNLCLRDT